MGDIFAEEFDNSVDYPTRSEEFIVGKDGKGGCANSTAKYDLTDIFGRAAGRENRYELTASPPINWKKVKNFMSCASCHNNQIRGGLNAKTSFDLIAFKILVDQSMPLGVHKNPRDPGSPDSAVVDELNPNERIALVSCLQAEFKLEANKTREWLQQISCGNNESFPDCSSTFTGCSVIPGGGRPSEFPGSPPQSSPPIPTAPSATSAL
jgi:hypothetical protein